MPEVSGLIDLVRADVGSASLTSASPNAPVRRMSLGSEVAYHQIRGSKAALRIGYRAWRVRRTICAASDQAEPCCSRMRHTSWPTRARCLPNHDLEGEDVASPFMRSAVSDRFPLCAVADPLRT
jgi:hypothetical protein